MILRIFLSLSSLAKCALSLFVGWTTALVIINENPYRYHHLLYIYVFIPALLVLLGLEYVGFRKLFGEMKLRNFSALFVLLVMLIGMVLEDIPVSEGPLIPYVYGGAAAATGLLMLVELPHIWKKENKNQMGPTPS